MGFGDGGFDKKVCLDVGELVDVNRIFEGETVEAGLKEGFDDFTVGLQDGILEEELGFEVGKRVGEIGVIVRGATGTLVGLAAILHDS